MNTMLEAGIPLKVATKKIYTLIEEATGELY
jgi:hypothetical protein